MSEYGTVIVKDGVSRPAEWHEEYGMRTNQNNPSSATVRMVRWLEARITALEARLDKQEEDDGG